MPIFTPLQIEKLLDLASRGRIAPIYIFIGPYPLIEEKAKKILDILLKQGSTLEVYDLRTQEGKKEFSQIKGYQEGLFGFRKVYLVYGAEEISQDKANEMIENLSRYEKPPFSWFLLSENFPEAHPLYQYASEKGAIIPFPGRRKEDLLEMELIHELKKNNCAMNKEVAQLFLSLVGDDYHHFKNELQKLLLYVGQGTEISESDVLQIVVPYSSSALFLIGDALFNKGPNQTLKLIEGLLDAKTEPTAIIAYLYKHFKKMEILKEFLAEHPEIEKENYYSTFIKKWQEIKGNPAVSIPPILAETHPYSLFTMKAHLKKVKNFVPLFQALFQAELSLKREFRKPEEVFPKLILDLWRSIEPH
jgi:DNA polymerase-3 subunit delta